MRDEDGKSQFLEHFGEHLKSIFREAQNSLGRMGFPRMHSNVVFVDASKDLNHNTGKIGDVAGYARRDKHYMALDMSTFIDHFRENPNVITETIVHEWAHLWMFQNSKQFKQTVKELYSNLVLSGLENFDPEISEIPEDVKNKLDESWGGCVASLYDILAEKIIQKIKINDKTIHLIPNANLVIDVYGTLKEDLLTAKKGDPIYCIYDNKRWYIRPIDAPKSITNLSFDDLKQLNKLIQTNFATFEDAITDSIAKSIESLPEFFKQEITDASEDTLREFILRKVKSYFDNIPIKLKLDIPNDVIQNYINKISNYLGTGLFNTINNPNTQKIIENFLFDNEHDGKSRLNFIQICFYSNRPEFDDWADPVGADYMQIILEPYIIKALKKDIAIETQRLKDLSGSPYTQLRNYVNKEIKWIDSYGMSNDEELWATAIEGFFKLPKEHKKVFIDLIQNKIKTDQQTTPKSKKSKTPQTARERRKNFKELLKNTVKDQAEKYKLITDGKFNVDLITFVIDKTIRILEVDKNNKTVKQTVYDSLIEYLNSKNYELGNNERRNLRYLIGI